MLEFAKGASGLVGLIGRLNGFKGFDAFDKQKRAPDAVVAIEEIRFAVTRWNDNQRAACMVADIMRFEFLSNVTGDAHHIVHHGSGILENVFVYLLMNVT